VAAVPLRSLLAAVLALLALVALSACGNRKETVTHAETEGIHVDVGELSYQIQISRTLSVHDDEDVAYLQDIPVAQRELAPNETWFAVFLKVFNDTKHDAMSAGSFAVVDTQDLRYEPIPLGKLNPFAYRAQVVAAGEQYPLPDSTAGAGVVRGSLLLFKLKFETLQNRPMELEIHGPEGEEPAEASALLDV